MNETTAELSATPKKKNTTERVFLKIVGANEDEKISTYAPYYPRFNLKPAKPLPTLMAVGAVSVTVAIAAAFTARIVLETQVNDTKFKAEELQREIESEQQMVKLIEQVNNQRKEAEGQLNLFQNVDDRLFRWSNAMDTFRCLVPSNLRLTSLKGDSDGQFFINGQSEDLGSIGYLMLNMRGSGLFYKPKLHTSEEDQVLDQSFYKFTLSSEILNPASASIPETMQRGPQK